MSIAKAGPLEFPVRCFVRCTAGLLFSIEKHNKLDYRRVGLYNDWKSVVKRIVAPQPAPFTIFRPSQGKCGSLTSIQNRATDFSIGDGTTGDIPIPGDDNGDAITDLAVFRPSQARWYVDTNRNGTTNFSVPFGVGTDIPLRPNGWILTTLGLLPQ